MSRAKPSSGAPDVLPGSSLIRVRRIHRRDLNRVWDFLKLVFRDVNRETVEYQRPHSKRRFVEVYEEEGVEQLLFELEEGGAHEIVGYAECAFEIVGADNWMNERYFSKREMRPLFVEELAVHPGYQGRGIGSFVLEQLEHLARVRGCTHIVLEVAENNERALSFYRGRNFYKIDAAIFLAKRVAAESELLPPRRLEAPAEEPGKASAGKGASARRKAKAGGVATAAERAHPRRTQRRRSGPSRDAPGSDDGAVGSDARSRDEAEER